MMDFWQDRKKQKKYFLALLIVVAVLLLPVFVIALYNRPSADDFGYALRTHTAFVQYGMNPAKIFAAAVESDAYYFNNWQGLYISGFLLPLQPAIFGAKWYALTTFFVVGILLFSLWGLFHFVVSRLRPGTRFLAPTLALLFTYAFVQGMPNQVEGLYWFNGAMNYIPYFALAILNSGILFGVYFRPDKRMTTFLWTTLCCLLSIVISGGHQVASLLNLLLLLIVFVAFVRKKRFWPMAPFLAGLIGLVTNITSPGTAVRTAGFSSASLPESVVKSFVLAALELVRWLDVPLLCFLALLTPLLLHLVKSDVLSDKVFCWPLLPAAITFVLVWGMIWLPSYTMGGIGPGRLINVVWMTFMIGIAVSYATLLGWLVRIRNHALSCDGKIRGCTSKKWATVGVALLLCMACIGGRTVKEGLDNRFATTLEALYELGNGTPQAFAAALDERTALLEDPANENVTIRPLTEDERPYLLFFSDVEPGTDSWGFTAYYGKESVRVQ